MIPPSRTVSLALFFFALVSSWRPVVDALHVGRGPWRAANDMGSFNNNNNNHQEQQTQQQEQPRKHTIQEVLRDYKETIQEIMRSTNEQRRQYILPELKYSAELAKSAQVHAEDMAEKDYMSHTNQEGSDVGERVLKNSDYRFLKVGENLYCRWPNNEPAEAVEDWMMSLDHRENLLNRDFEEVGIGYAQGRGDKHYYVQVLGKPLPGILIGDGIEETCKVLHKLSNEARLSFTYLAPLRNSEELNQAAQRCAEDMARNGRLAGDGDNHASVLENDLSMAGYSYKTFAANFAFRSPFNDPHSIFQDWLNGQDTSPCYVLDQTFSDIGYGYAQAATKDGQKQHYYVQLVGAPKKESPGENRPMSTREVLHKLTEQSRQVANLRPLHQAEELDEAAQQHAEELARRGRLSGSGLEERIQFTGYTGEAYAANVNHRASVNDPMEIFREWLTDEEHRYVLDDAFSDVGYGYATSFTDEDEVEHYYVQILGARLQRLGFQSSFAPFGSGIPATTRHSFHRPTKVESWKPDFFT